MKKNLVRLLLASILIIGNGIALTACSDKEDEVEMTIGVKDLPMEAQTFLSTYFNGIEIKSIEKQTISTVIMYEVELQNGFDIMFNSSGVWQEVDAPDGKTLPSGIAPEAIETYVNQNYPDYGINEINKTGNGYNVELNDTIGTELEFNLLGEFVRVITSF